MKPRPVTPLEAFEKALERAEISKSEKELIEYIRYVGTFTQVSLTQSLRLKPKPPVLSIISDLLKSINHGIK